MMKIIIRIIELIISVIIIFLMLIIFDIFIKKQDVVGKKVIIRKNEKITDIYKDLGIKYSVTDKIFYKYTNEAKNIKVGSVNFEKNISKKEILDLLKNPNLVNIKLTIPEGFTSEQVLDRLEKLNICSKKDMLEAMKNYDFYYKHNEVFEGYLYPQTYFFESEKPAKEVLDVILNHFLELYPPTKHDKNTFYNQLILASIIEKEARIDEDRKAIAAVFYNRLKIGMPLQSDATLKYELKRFVYKKDLMISNSKYNTYKHKGLTPSPIANPSSKSIDAAINPAKNDYLYFFMYDNKTYYSKTHKEHLRKRKESGHIK